MKTLMFYDLAAPTAWPGSRPPIQPTARLREVHARGVLLMAGPDGGPPVGAVGVFTTREAAEEFARGDRWPLGAARRTLTR